MQMSLLQISLLRSMWKWSLKWRLIMIFRTDCDGVLGSDRDEEVDRLMLMMVDGLWCNLLMMMVV
ncbi:hypothetical protein Hdeb2414_s0002g00074111 [Helianthus debilis subsp. tardiflorus]